MQIVWRAKARADFRRIIDYISDRSQSAAIGLETATARTVEFLSINPLMYRPGRLPDTREAVIHPNYVIVYRVAADRIIILAVLHARQSYP
jgi:toxin ParE1/3/4